MVKTPAPGQSVPHAFPQPAGRPVDSGISLQAVRELGPDFPLFGVCMGHQCIGEAFGGGCWRVDEDGGGVGVEVDAPQLPCVISCAG